MKKMLLTLASTAAAAAPIATVVACGSTEAENYEIIKVALEKDMRPLFDAALEAMTEEEKGGYTFEFVELENGGGLDYLDTVSSRGKDAASIFALAADRFSGMVDQKLLVKNAYTGGGEDLVTIGGETYGVPMNTESVFQIYNGDTSIGAIDPYLADHTNGSTDTFVTQFGNLWHGSTIMNTAISTMAGGYDSDNWVNQDANGNWNSPALTDDAFTGALEDLYAYYEQLHGGSTELVNVATNTDRDSIIRAGIADGSITHTIDGPWVINDIIARTLSGEKDDAEKTAALDLLADIKADKLPTYNGTQMAHFAGGWGFGMNAPRVDAVADGETYTAAMDAFLANIIDASLATDWFTLTGKLPVNGNITITEDIVADMEITDPTVAGGETKIKFADWKDATDTDGNSFASILSGLYSDVSSAVTEQNAFNVAAPSGAGWNFWDSFDAQGFSNAANFETGKDASQFVTKFQSDINKIFSELNVG